MESRHPLSGQGFLQGFAQVDAKSDGYFESGEGKQATISLYQWGDLYAF
jgi:hypothetical protein